MRCSQLDWAHGGRDTPQHAGRGEKLANITQSMQSVAEGVKTSEAAAKLAKQLDLECPILEGIHRVIHGELLPLF